MDLHLTRISLDLHDQTARNMISDVNYCHQQLMSAMPSDGKGRSGHHVLWRQETPNHAQLLVQTVTHPDWTRLNASTPNSRIDTKTIGTQLHAAVTSQHQFAFRLAANPTRKIDTKTRLDGTKSNGRRVPIREPQAQIDWLERKLHQNGATLAAGTHGQPQLETSATFQSRGTRNGSTITIEGVTYTGILQVADPDQLLHGIRTGIGPAKAYGFGLLTLAAR